MQNNTNTAPFLLELQTEELPAHQVKPLLEALLKSVQSLFDTQQMRHQAENWGSGATPRRLAVWCSDVPYMARSQPITHRGPPLRIAYDASGNPTPAAIKFAEKCGLSLEELAHPDYQHDGYLTYTELKPGNTLENILVEQLPILLETLPVAKRMRWGAHKFTFIRPIQGLMVLHGQKTYPVVAFDHLASNQTPGHRFHHTSNITLTNPLTYTDQLYAAKVIVDIEKRTKKIEDGILQAAAAQQCTAIIAPALLEEVTQLVEWPVVLTAHFDPKFLTLPEEVLVTTMMHHQRYFPLRTANGTLSNYFVIVSNIESADPARIIGGNIRVVHARLADAAFFYNTDKQTPLETRVDALKNIIFQKELGTMYARMERVQALASCIAEVCAVSVPMTARAAYLSKADLVTHMVGEFPELQGTMGHYYAMHDKEPVDIAEAIEDAYKPRFSKDLLPQTPIGTVLALADRIDTIVGFFSIGQKPTGTKDPYALRRAMLGVLRILLNHTEALDFRFLLVQSGLRYQRNSNDALYTEILEFAADRLKVLFQEEGFSPLAITAVLSTTTHTMIPVDIAQRVKALQAMMDSPDMPPLAAANKRVAKLLEKNNIQITQWPHINASLLVTPEEVALAEAIETQRAEVIPYIAQHAYIPALEALLELRAPLDVFFEKVLVITDHIETKQNRLALLTQVRYLFLQVGDISCLSQ